MTSEHRHWNDDADGAEVPVRTRADGSGGAEVKGAGAGEGASAKETGVGATAKDEHSDPRARALRVPGNSIVGSSRFQQFFFMYAKLMAGLRD